MGEPQGAAHPSAGWGGLCQQGWGQYGRWECGRWQWKCEGRYVPARSTRREVGPCAFDPGKLFPGAVPAAVEPHGQGERSRQGSRCRRAHGSARRLLLRCPFLCREKLVKAVVELLSTEVAEKAVVVLTLRLLAALLARYDWRVPFATEGGVRAVLGCMQQHGSSALVQQAGLAVSGAEGML